jgi:Fe-S-cluster containining protein
VEARPNLQYLRIDALATLRFMKVTEPRFLPWWSVASWKCDACGECCKWFSVSVTMHEYARISHHHGHDVVTLSLGRALLRKRCDGRCIFQYCESGSWLCGLQAEKPYACKMWPFIVSVARVTMQKRKRRGFAKRYLEASL